MTSVFYVNLIWISMKNYVLASCFVPLEFLLKTYFWVLLSRSVFNFRDKFSVLLLLCVWWTSVPPPCWSGPDSSFVFLLSWGPCFRQVLAAQQPIFCSNFLFQGAGVLVPTGRDLLPACSHFVGLHAKFHCLRSLLGLVRSDWSQLFSRFYCRSRSLAPRISILFSLLLISAPVSVSPADFLPAQSISAPRTVRRATLARFFLFWPGETFFQAWSFFSHTSSSGVIYKRVTSI
jgi:hypothetical protein